MSYVLDGIKTAYEMKDMEGIQYYDVLCPCGYTFNMDSNDETSGLTFDTKAALYWHFDHCVQARIPDVEREDVDSEA